MMKSILFSFIFLFVLAVNVAAFGVVTPPLNNNTLDIIDGEVTIFTMGIQNLEAEDITVKLGLSSQGDIAKFLRDGGNTIIPANSVNHPIELIITAPPDADIGDMYKISFSAQPGTVSGGAVGLRLGINKNFYAKVVPNPQKFYFGRYLEENKLMWPIIGAIIAAYIWFRSNDNKKRKKRKK